MAQLGPDPVFGALEILNGRVTGASVVAGTWRGAVAEWIDRVRRPPTRAQPLIVGAQPLAGERTRGARLDLGDVALRHEAGRAHGSHGGAGWIAIRRPRTESVIGLNFDERGFPAIDAERVDGRHAGQTAAHAGWLVRDAVGGGKVLFRAPRDRVGRAIFGISDLAVAVPITVARFAIAIAIAITITITIPITITITVPRLAISRIAVAITRLGTLRRQLIPGWWRVRASEQQGQRRGDLPHPLRYPIRTPTAALAWPGTRTRPRAGASRSTQLRCFPRPPSVRPTTACSRRHP